MSRNGSFPTTVCPCLAACARVRVRRIAASQAELRAPRRIMPRRSTPRNESTKRASSLLFQTSSSRCAPSLPPSSTPIQKRVFHLPLHRRDPRNPKRRNNSTLNRLPENSPRVGWVRRITDATATLATYPSFTGLPLRYAFRRRPIFRGCVCLTLPRYWIYRSVSDIVGKFRSSHTRNNSF